MCVHAIFIYLLLFFSLGALLRFVRSFFVLHFIFFLFTQALKSTHRCTPPNIAYGITHEAFVIGFDGEVVAIDN